MAFADSFHLSIASTALCDLVSLTAWLVLSTAFFAVGAFRPGYDCALPVRISNSDSSSQFVRVRTHSSGPSGSRTSSNLGAESGVWQCAGCQANARSPAS